MCPTGPTSQSQSSPQALLAREKLFALFRNRPMGDEELLVNLGLYMRSGPLAKLLFLNEIYQKIVHIPGVICEFGVWWGQTLAVFENLRAVYEPYNFTRKVLGFDTFVGYQNISERDQKSSTIMEGVYGVGLSHEQYLDELLSYHESENVSAHFRKHELVKGDATTTCSAWFEKNTEALVALAYFDMALYEPTRACLQAIRPRLVKGSLVVFDELCQPAYRGETEAALEVLGLDNFAVARSQFLPDRTYFHQALRGSHIKPEASPATVRVGVDRALLSRCRGAPLEHRRELLAEGGNASLLVDEEIDQFEVTCRRLPRRQDSTRNGGVENELPFRNRKQPFRIGAGVAVRLSVQAEIRQYVLDDHRWTARAQAQEQGDVSETLPGDAVDRQDL